jgi:vesicle coat complex subunit
MTSVIRVGQSKFAAVPIDEDSQERIMNCIETLAQLQGSKAVKQVFLEDTKSAYARMVATEEVSQPQRRSPRQLTVSEKGAGQEGSCHEGNWDPSRRPYFLPPIVEKVCRW